MGRLVLIFVKFVCTITLVKTNRKFTIHIYRIATWYAIQLKLHSDGSSRILNCLETI